MFPEPSANGVRSVCDVWTGSSTSKISQTRLKVQIVYNATLRYGRRGVLRRLGAGLFELGTVLCNREFVSLYFLPVVVDLKAKTLGEHVLEHQVELLAGGTFENLGRDIEARLVHPVLSYQLLGAEIEGDPDDVVEGHVLARPDSRGPGTGTAARANCRSGVGRGELDRDDIEGRGLGTSDSQARKQ